MVSTANIWRRCSNCKKEIPFGAKYQLCSVASCTKARAPTQFCSADCWAVHNEVENHKDAWAVEQQAPKSEGASQTTSSPKPSSPKPSTPSAAAAPASSSTEPSSSSSGDGEVYIVISKLKDFIKDVSNGMSTSAEVIGPLNDHVKKLCEVGIASANQHQRKTVLGRDIPRPASQGKDAVLVVISRLKEYVRLKSEMRTSEEVPDVISDELRRVALAGVESARKNGRKTVMGRDIPKFTAPILRAQ